MIIRIRTSSTITMMIKIQKTKIIIRGKKKTWIMYNREWKEMKKRTYRRKKIWNTHKNENKHEKIWQKGKKKNTKKTWGNKWGRYKTEKKIRKWKAVKERKEKINIRKIETKPEKTRKTKKKHIKDF